MSRGYGVDEYGLDYYGPEAFAPTVSLPEHMIIVYNQNFEPIHIFTSFRLFTYKKVLDGQGDYVLIINYQDTYVEDFELDSMIVLRRRVRSRSNSWYTEFVGLHRDFDIDTDETGDTVYISSGLCLNHLLGRTKIAYPDGTIQAYKSDVSETAMKEYVIENCGDQATIANGRKEEGILPNFTITASTGAGVIWTGEEGYSRLLDVLFDIAIFATIDFDVTFDGANFVFNTYIDQLGEDRTIVGLDSTTGLNAAGNAPVIFSVGYANIRSMTYYKRRAKEINTIFILGQGKGATKKVISRTDISARADSPWNRMESSRNKNGYTSEMETAGDVILAENSAKEGMDFIPLLQRSSVYGYDFWFGDKITGKAGILSKNKRIVGASGTIDEDGEALALAFADL